MHTNLLAIALFFTLFAIVQITADKQPLLLKYRDDDGYVRMKIVKNPNFRKSCDNSENISDESDEHLEENNSFLHEYSIRDGPHESSESTQDMYNISDEEEGEQSISSNEEKSSEERNIKTYSKHIYARDHYSESDVDSTENKNKYKKRVYKDEKESSSSSEEVKYDKSKKNKKKIVYVYKQPPIVVHPKPTNVFIKPKPILVQPPPLVVHQAAPKTCNPVIKYKPPNIRVQPVIVKIKKPATTTTTTTTTPCPKTTTTRKPCRKCRRKPTEKCNRCSSKRKYSKNQSQEYKVYYNGYRQSNERHVLT